MGGPWPTRARRPPASPAAPRSPRVASPARAHPASAYPLGSRQRVSAYPPCVAGGARATTCTARATGVFAMGARPAGAALALSAASSSALPALAVCCCVVYVRVLTGMCRAHVNIFATRSRAQRAYFSPPHSRRSPRRSLLRSARHRARGCSPPSRDRTHTTLAPFDAPLAPRAAADTATGRRARSTHRGDRQPPRRGSGRPVSHRQGNKLSRGWTETLTAASPQQM